MAVNIDTVYQKVLAFANKEQRGYITPQEFNLFAGHAQLEILDQYFYDINQFGRLHGNDTEYSDMLNLLDEKLAVNKSISSLTGNNGIITIPGWVYKLGSVFVNNVECEQVNYNELKTLEASPLARPTTDNPVYTLHGGSSPRSISTYPVNNTVSISYVRRPDKPKWGYVVVNKRALYDPTNSVHFSLHKSEEVDITYKILKYAGVSIQKDTLAQSANTMEIEKTQQEKQ